MTGCVLVAHTVSACRRGKAPSRDSPHATCARTSLEQADLRGKYLRWSNFPSHRGFNSDPARASCSVRTGWLSSSLWGLSCQISCGSPALRPLWGGGFRAADSHSTPPPARCQPLWTSFLKVPLYSQVRVVKKVSGTATRFPICRPQRHLGGPAPTVGWAWQ